MSAKFVLKPEDLSVVVASNLNADILSDLGSALAGSLGLAASANYNPERRFPSMFEPVHGSAPDIAGPGRRQPDRHDPVRRADARPLRPADEAARLQKAVDATTGSGAHPRHRRHRHTDEVVAAIIDNLGLEPSGTTRACLAEAWSRRCGPRHCRTSTRHRSVPAVRR